MSTNDPRAIGALEALRVAAQNIDALANELSLAYKLAAIEGAPSLLRELLQITGRIPRIHLGHLHPLQFEAVRGLLAATPRLITHADGVTRFVVIEEVRYGLEIWAQRSPEADDLVAAEGRA